MWEESRARKQSLVEFCCPRRRATASRSKDWFDRLCKGLTERFGEVTSFLRSPAEGFWSTEHSLARENIAVLEVMTETFDETFWRVLRRRLEQDLSQEEIVIRCQEIQRV